MVAQIPMCTTIFFSYLFFRATKDAPRTPLFHTSQSPFKQVYRIPGAVSLLMES